MKKLNLTRIIKEQLQEDLIDVVENCLTEIDQEEQSTDQDWKIMGRDNPNQTLRNFHDRTNRLLDPYGAFILGAKAGLQAKLLQKDQIIQLINILKKLRITINDAASMPGRKDAKEPYLEMKTALKAIKIVLSKALGGREMPKYQSPFDSTHQSPEAERPEREISPEESAQRKKDARKFEELKDLLKKTRAMQAERQAKKNNSDDLERRIRDKKKQGFN